MYKITSLLLMLISIGCFAQDALEWDRINDQVLLGIGSDQIYKVGLDGSLIGYEGCKLIIRGDVEIYHKDEDIDAERAKVLEIKFDTIIFTPGSRLFTRSNLALAPTKYLSGDVVILSSRGQAGKDGITISNSPPQASHGANGQNGSNGNGGGFFWSDAGAGQPGTNGSHGKDGVDGGNGGFGSRGTDASHIIIEVMNMDPNTTFKISAVGGNGGKGGNGGPGGLGGPGGNGGVGGKGGSVDGIGGDGGNGGRGGHGGNGGNGGNGGAGGDGGPGGNGGDIHIYFSAELPEEWIANQSNIHMNSPGGKGGLPGLGGPGGLGGKGGKGGNGGDGKKGTIVSCDGCALDGKNGRDGERGRDGIDGEIGLSGPDGRRGPDGRPGQNGVTYLKRVEPRAPSFYDLVSIEQFNIER